MTIFLYRFGIVLLLLASVVAWAPPRLPSMTRQQDGAPSPLQETAKKALMTVLTVLVVNTMPAVAASDPTDFPAAKRYWTIMDTTKSTPQERLVANEALLDHAVGTINTLYYDNSGGFNFSPKELYDKWRRMRDASKRNTVPNSKSDIPNVSLQSREGAVQGLKWLVSTLNDPFSKYLTREELKQELKGGNDGFLGLGAMVEPPQESIFHVKSLGHNKQVQKSTLLSSTRVDNLPVVTAVAPNSPAERAGVTVGDRIVAVGSDKFLGLTKAQVTKTLKTKYNAENYAGQAHVTVAKPVVMEQEEGREVVTGYRLSKLKLATITNEPFNLQNGVLGDAIVQYKLLTSSDSILDNSSSNVGYIRLTRFSRAATIRFFNAIDKLEAAGAQSYIIDLRNNYGGVIQEAMLTASTLLRDPHAVLCYTMNSRGGFTPHDVEEYIVDARYPGYLLSSEPKTVSINQVRRENPEMFDGINVPPSSFASLREQSIKRGIHRTPVLMATSPPAKQWNVVGRWLFPVANAMNFNAPYRMQKKIVLLINEGTASSAEVFASALHDNGRTVLVGTKSYGKGLIQHTFPMPDGGGLRLTVAEYLTPSLHHVTKVGSARYDPVTGDWIGGGIRPDVYCESRRGIPSNIGADFCVGTALDVLEETNVEETRNLASLGSDGLLTRAGGSTDGSGHRRPIVASQVKDDF